MSNDDTDLDGMLNKLDGVIEKLSSERSDLGARYNRLEMVDDRLSQQETMAKRIMSDNEDAEIERVRYLYDGYHRETGGDSPQKSRCKGSLIVHDRQGLNPCPYLPIKEKNLPNTEE